MKFANGDTEELALRKILFLRYGLEVVDRAKPPPALLSWRSVSQILRLPYQRVVYVKDKFFGSRGPQDGKRAQDSSRVTRANLTLEELEFLISSETLRLWAPYSAQMRCCLFHRRFPDRRISPHVLMRVMKEAGMRRKKILVLNAPQRKSERLGEFEAKILALDEQVHRILQQGGHLVFCDEATFTARSFQSTAWAKPRENVVVEDRTGLQPCQAVCAAVCACHKLLAYVVEDYSIDKWKFIGFLRELRASTGDETVYLFLDNARFHHGPEVKQEMDDLAIVPVWNVPYHFQYNEACEKYWALLKSRFRPLLLKKMLLTPRRHETPLKDAVREVIAQTEQGPIVDFVRRGLSFLRREADDVREARGEKRLHRP